MESYNYERFITETVEAMLPRFSSREIALVMGINSNMSLYRKNNEYCASERFLVIFHRPSNYTKVLIKKIE
ncbi:MAG: hypothetical protein M0P14_00835, partial [Alkaliphilus sp.]|nr:hypothetical protein [Alkaliphilus sp.]